MTNAMKAKRGREKFDSHSTSLRSEIFSFVSCLVLPGRAYVSLFMTSLIISLQGLWPNDFDPVVVVLNRQSPSTFLLSYVRSRPGRKLDVCVKGRGKERAS